MYWTSFAYDALGQTTVIPRPTAVRQKLHNQRRIWQRGASDGAESCGWEHSAGYNLLLQQDGPSDAGINAARHDANPDVYYDLLTKLTSETHPETGTTQYTYRAGNHGGVLLESKTDAKGQKTLFENYDQYNRLGRKRFFNASHGEDVCQQVNYTYDAYTAAMGTNLGGGWEG